MFDFLLFVSLSYRESYELWCPRLSSDVCIVITGTNLLTVPRVFPFYAISGIFLRRMHDIEVPSYHVVSY